MERVDYLDFAGAIVISFWQACAAPCFCKSLMNRDLGSVQKRLNRRLKRVVTLWLNRSRRIHRKRWLERLSARAPGEEHVPDSTSQTEGYIDIREAGADGVFY
jgi:hypothetical protein